MSLKNLKAFLLSNIKNYYSLFGFKHASLYGLGNEYQVDENFNLSLFLVDNCSIRF